MPINPSPAVLRACDVLVEMARDPDQAFNTTELARRVGIARATCDAILLALAERGFVIRREEDLAYELGQACVALGDAARSANAILNAASAEAEQLARDTASCVAIATRDTNNTRVVEVFDFGPPFGVRTTAGQSIALVPPFGAVFVAWDDDASVDHWLASPNEQLSEAELTRYRDALAAVRRRGFSVSIPTVLQPDLVNALASLVNAPGQRGARSRRDELMREMVHTEYLPTDIDARSTHRVSQMSAPVFDQAGAVVMAIMLLGPNYEVTGADIATIGGQLVSAATRATQAAGGRARALTA
jgi:DNA-binding IclR family transcriptional regulator